MGADTNGKSQETFQMQRTDAAHLDLTVKRFGVIDVADVVSVVIFPKICHLFKRFLFKQR